MSRPILAFPETKIIVIDQIEAKNSQPVQTEKKTKCVNVISSGLVILMERPFIKIHLGEKIFCLEIYSFLYVENLE